MCVGVCGVEWSVEAARQKKDKDRSPLSLVCDWELTLCDHHSRAWNSDMTETKAAQQGAGSKRLVPNHHFAIRHLFQLLSVVWTRWE
jgi:hypothetical protein